MTELLGTNLRKLIESKGCEGLPLPLVRTYLFNMIMTETRFATQILRCLVFLGQRRLLHCDLKPDNILLVDPSKTEIKIIDFGSSCFERDSCLVFDKKTGLFFEDVISLY